MVNRIIILFSIFFSPLIFSVAIPANNEVGINAPINRNFTSEFKPIIGIISQPLKGTNHSSIQQSYVNFIETGGGRVAPIKLDISDQELFSITKSINGVLFPGGGTILEKDSRYYSLHQFFMDYSIQQTKKGNHFPIWGTCLGFEAIIQYASNNFTLIPDSKFHNFNILLNLEWNGDNDKLFSSHLLNLCKASILQSKHDNSIPEFSNKEVEPNVYNYESPHKEFKLVLKRELSLKKEHFSSNSDINSLEHWFNNWDQLMCSHRLFRAMQWLPLAAYNHQNGITLTDWNMNPNLENMLDPLAFSTSDDGTKFVAIVEAKDYPIYGVQFHPEKNLFAFSPSINAPHGFFSAEMTQYFSNFFINEARKSKQRFQDLTSEFEHLIFKYTIYNSPLSDKIYEFLPLYLFPMDPEMLYETVSIDDME